MGNCSFQEFLGACRSIHCCSRRAVLSSMVGTCRRCLEHPKELARDYGICEECEDEMMKLSDELRGILGRES
jgi:hypothetical protein